MAALLGPKLLSRFMQVLAGMLFTLGAVTQSEMPLDEEYLFASHEITDFTLDLPFGELFKKKKKIDVTAPGALIFTNSEGVETRVPVSINSGSGMRSEFCQVPPLAISLPRELSDTSRFNNLKTLYLTTHCKRGSEFEQYLSMEYMMYRMYGLLNEHSLGVRRARMRYEESGGKRKAIEGHGYVIEDLDAVVKRLGLQVIKLPTQRLSDLDPSVLSLVSLFQFVIGNTDWSAFANKPGKSCCHNGFVVAPDPSAPNRIIVPYDFDQAGMIDTKYAMPSAKLGIRSVKQRLYRGNCVLNSHLPKAIESLNAARPEFEALFNDDPLLSNKYKKKALNYLSTSFSILNSPEQFEKQIIGKCRQGERRLRNSLDPHHSPLPGGEETDRASSFKRSVAYPLGEGSTG